MTSLPMTRRFFLKLHGELTALPQPHLRAVWQAIGFALRCASLGHSARAHPLFPLHKTHRLRCQWWIARRFAEDEGLVASQGDGALHGISPDIAERLAEIIADPGKAARLHSRLGPCRIFCKGMRIVFLARHGSSQRLKMPARA
jgi:hypothetical protein